MENRYIIRKLPDTAGVYPFHGAFDPDAMDAPYRGLDALDIALYPWGGNYRPEAHARVGWNENGLIVLMYANEADIRADERQTGGRVCEDSCLEFFLAPFPDADARYLNVEINPIGTAHIGLGAGRPDRRVWRALPEGFTIAHSSHQKSWWAVSYRIPAAFLAQIYAGRTFKSGSVLRANFYKCDESIHPHFGCWNRVEAPQPDFHRPECFGYLVME